MIEEPFLSTLSIDRRDGVAVLTLCRPAKRNALDDATVLRIEEFFRKPGPDVRAVVLDAEGDHFSAGVDLGELTERSTEEALEHSLMWHRVFDTIEGGGVPVVTALKGAVIGGGLELAAAAHLRVADPTTFYALPEGQRGLFVGGGGSVRVPRLIGAHRMADMMLTGRVLDAAQGHRRPLALPDRGGRGTRQGPGARGADRGQRAADQLRRPPGAPPHTPRPIARRRPPARVPHGRRRRRQHRRPGEDAGLPRRPRRKGHPMSEILSTPGPRVEGRVGDRALPPLAGGGAAAVVPGLRQPVAVVRHRPGGLLVLRLGVLRRPSAHPAHRRPGPQVHAGHRVVPGRDPQLRRARPRARGFRRGRRRRRGRRPLPDAGAGRADLRRAPRPGRPGPRRAPASASARATGSSPICRTSPRRSSPSSPRRASARSGRPAHRSSGRAASSTASPSSNRRCCSPSPATTTGSGTSIATRSRRSRRSSRPAVERVVHVPYGPHTVPDALGWAELLAEPATGPLVFEPVPFDRPVRAVLLRHHGHPQGDRPPPRRDPP
ncbi:Fatty acid oxidation complex subunit alpha [Streptomyces narbonensis]